MERPSLGARLAKCSGGLRWKSWQGNAAGLRWRARLERVPGAASLTLQVSENPIDDSGIGRTGAGIGRCGDLKHAIVGPSDAIGCKRRARHVTREPLQLPGIFRGERLSGENIRG